MYRRTEEPGEQGTMNESSNESPDNHVQLRKKGFRKSSSAEPTAASSLAGQGVGKNQRKKSFTTFWSSLFGSKIPENRHSGISTQSSSFESVNTILSTNSFSFVSPKKYKGKQKGKRIPVPVEEPSKPKRKISTLTRLGMRIGLKSKYNLQSCESLHNLNYLESGGASNSGTLSSTYRRKRRAPPPPNGTLPRNHSTLTRNSSPLPRHISPLPKSSPQISKHFSKPPLAKSNPPLSKATSSKTVETPPVRSNSPQPSTSSNVPSTSNSVNQQKILKKSPSQEESETSHRQTPPEDTPVAGSSKSALAIETFKITARHKRSSSEGTSTISTEPNKLHTNTLTNTYKTKSHVRGKRKAPIPPNPFGDPDAPEEEAEMELLATTPSTISVPTAAAKAHPPDNAPVHTSSNPTNGPTSSSSRIHAEVTTTAPSDTQAVTPPLLTPTQEQDEEIAQNILNDKQEQRSAQQQQRQEHTDQPEPGPSRGRSHGTSISENDLEAAQKDLQVLIAISSQKRKTDVDEPARVQLTQLKREADKSPLMFLRPKSSYNSTSPNGTKSPNGTQSSNESRSPSGSSKNHFRFNLDSDDERTNPFNHPSSPAFPSDEPISPSSTSSNSPLFPPTTNSSGASSKLTPRPWYKRNISSSHSSKKSKQLIKPVSSMTKFSDIDREAARIVEENRRRSAEQAYNETARELITMFNAFNKSQIAPNMNPEYERDSNEAENTENETHENLVTNSIPVQSTTTQVPISEARGNVNGRSTAIVNNDAVESNNSVASSSATTGSFATHNGTTPTPNTKSPGITVAQSSEQIIKTQSTVTLSSTTGTVNVVNGATGTTEEPKKLAIVQPQSSRVNASSNASSASSTTQQPPNTINKVSVGISTSAYLSPRRQNWTCPRCTLQNLHWRLTCEACYYKGESTVQKLSSVFENVVSEIQGGPGPDNHEVKATIKASLSTNPGNSSGVKAGTQTMVKDKDLAPLCENFLSQLPAKETLAREGKLVGMKLHVDTGEELDIVRLRQARLAFFEKNVGSMDGESSAFTCVSTSYQPQDDGATDVTESNNLAMDTDENNGIMSRKEVIEKKELNVFSDDEDDSIDALLQIPRFRSLDNSPVKTKDLPNMPTFSGPNRSWNPLHHHRFRPMLESILESSHDVYLRLDPIYENWDLSLQPNGTSINSNVGPDSSAAGRAWTNTFMPIMHDPFPHNSPTDNNNGYYANSNSDSSSCSEYETQALAGEHVGMDGKNRAPSRRHSSHHHHPHHHRYLYANQVPGGSRQEGRKLTLEDYRKLGAIPKNFEGYYNNIASGTDDPDGSNGFCHRNGRQGDDPRRHSSYTSPDELRPSEGDNSYDNSYADSTVAVNKLLRKLENAISKGDHRLAATLAHDLALLKVNCVVAKGEQKSPPITIRVYVEDRFMQQGPFQVQVTQTMSVQELKKKIETDWNIPSAFQKWILGRRIAEVEEQTLAEFDVEHDTMAFLYLVTPQIEKKEAPQAPKSPKSTDRAETSTKITSSPKSIAQALTPNPATPSTSTAAPNLSKPKPVEKKEPKLLPEPKAQENTNVKLMNIATNTDIKTNKVATIEKLVPTPLVTSTTEAVNKSTKTSIEVLPPLKAASNESLKPRDSKPQHPDLKISPEKKLVPIVVKKEASTTPRPLEQLPKPSQNIKSMSTKSMVAEPVEPKNLGLFVTSKSTVIGAKIQEIIKTEVPVPVAPKAQATQKPIPKKDNAPKQEGKTKVESPIKSEKLANNLIQPQTSATAKSPNSIRSKKEEQHLPAVVPKTEAVQPKSLENIKPTSNTKTESVNKTTKPHQMQTTPPSTAKTELPTRKSNDVPNWNPEPIPKRRTKNLKKNNPENNQVAEVPTTVPGNTADIKQKNIPNFTSSEVAVDTKSGAATVNVPPKPPKPVATPIKTEHVYSNGTSTPPRKSPIPPQSASPPPKIQNQDIPPPLPEKKPINKEIKEVNTVPLASPKPPQNLLNTPTTRPLSPNSKSLENNSVTEIPTAQIVKLTENVPIEPENINLVPNAGITVAGAAVAPSEEATSQKEDNRETYLRMLHLMEQSDLICNMEELECPICFSQVLVNEGVVLRDCLHSFCKECLIGSVQYADEPEVKCPFRDDKYSCQSVVQEREIKALVPSEIFERYLARSVKVAECKIVNTFHCKTADCTGWCVFEDDVNVFNCPVCKKRNCLTCQAIHEGVDCQQYQRQLAIDSETDENAKSSRLMLEKMIQRGEALECPACHVVLLKKWGCDWVRCSYCKTEICWITKGFRWGPNGKGDTSGGCQCGVNGVRCHPKCTYCH